MKSPELFLSPLQTFAMLVLLRPVIIDASETELNSLTNTLSSVN
ncbi:hypothetical protein [Tenacibaculum singaporense]|nr:hypothetical protein [Tenacibaculum singaporense]